MLKALINLLKDKLLIFTSYLYAQILKIKIIPA
jgi:hypothetical protein